MRHEVIDLPDGWAGTDATVEAIQRLVEGSLQDPLVVSTAHDIVRHLPERDRAAELRAVSAFVRSKIRYTSEAIETIKTPRLLLQEIRRHGRAVGDCDDHVVLWAALLRALGHTVRFRVVSQRPDGLANHIFGEAFTAGGWVSDDLIVKHKPLGWRVPPGEVSQEKEYGFGLGGAMIQHSLEMTGAVTALRRAAALERARRIAAMRRRKPRRRPAGLFVPGGARKQRHFGLPPARMLSGNVTTEEYAFKSGSNLVVAEEGGELGFIPWILMTASSAIKQAKDIKKQAKEAKKSLLPDLTKARELEYRPDAPAGRNGTSTYLLLGGAALLALVLLKR